MQLYDQPWQVYWPFHIADSNESGKNQMAGWEGDTLPFISAICVFVEMHLNGTGFCVIGSF